MGVLGGFFCWFIWFFFFFAFDVRDWLVWKMMHGIICSLPRKGKQLYFSREVQAIFILAGETDYKIYQCLVVWDVYRVSSGIILL